MIKLKLGVPGESQARLQKIQNNIYVFQPVGVFISHSKHDAWVLLFLNGFGPQKIDIVNFDLVRARETKENHIFSKIMRVQILHLEWPNLCKTQFPAKSTSAQKRDWPVHAQCVQQMCALHVVHTQGEHHIMFSQSTR